MHLADFMAERGLSDEYVAKMIRRSRPTVSRIRRRVCRPDWDTIQRIEEFSQRAVTASDFIDLGGSQ